MKRVRCPKCDSFIVFDETKYNEGQSLVFVCSGCKKEFRIRIGKSKMTNIHEERNIDENAYNKDYGSIIVVENKFAFKQIIPLDIGDNEFGRYLKGTNINKPIETSDPSIDTFHCVIRYRDILHESDSQRFRSHQSGRRSHYHHRSYHPHSKGCTMNPLESFSKTTVNYKLTDMDNLINFQDNYYCFDNLQMGFDPKIKAVSQQGNDDFHIVIAVQQGNMGLIINGQEVRMKSNDFLIIMPFTKVEVLTSRCTVFCCVIRNYIALDMYNKIGCPDNIVENCYTFHHYHFHPQQLEIMQHDYLRIKDIMLRQAPSLHEEMLKAGIGIYMSHMFSFLAVNSRIEYKSPLFHRQVFDKFLRALSEHYKEERKVEYYAKLLDLPSKQITTATHKYAGKTASRVINEYVIFKIKAVLYNNQLSVKTVSEMFNFPNQSFFGRYFKRVTGYSPAKFLNLHSKKLSKQNPALL